ncbi:MAG: glycosyltransferase [Nitrospiraceae bacterium]|nr:MAG: glycosyltransferase [Nitrospiraceae bacterium]
MINVQIIYQWRTSLLGKRLLKPLEGLHRDRKLNLSVYDVSHYRLGNVSKADVLILSNIIEKSADSIVSEARLRGTKLLYDSCVNDGKDKKSLPGFFEELYYDIRAFNIRDRLIKMSDMVTSRDGKVVLDHRHAETRHRLVQDCSSNEWSDAIAAVLSKHTLPKAETKGKRILFLSPTLMWPHNYISDVLVRNLMEMGHEVNLFTPKPSRFHTEAICLPENFNDRFMKRLTGYAEDVWKIPPLISRSEIDLVITVQGYIIPRQVLREIRRAGVASAVWLLDEPYDASRSCSIGSYFTHVFLQDRASIHYHRRFGNPNSFYLPHGCDPYGIHGPYPDDQGYKRDVALVGSPFPERIELVRSLMKSGIHVEVVGNGWEEIEFARSVHNLSLEDASQYYRNTKININLHRNEDDFSTNPGMFKAMSPNCSTFYIAGSGAFQLVDEHRGDLKEYFNTGNEIVTFRDIQDCAEKIRHYLENEDERQKVTNASYERACRDHTYAERLKTLLKIVDEEEAISFDDGHRRTGYVQMCGQPIQEHQDMNSRYNIVQVCDMKTDINRNSRTTVLKMTSEDGFSNALNRALFEISSDYIIVGDSKLIKTRLEIEEYIHLFNRDVRLGLILFQGHEKEIAGFLIPARVLMETGIFRFGNATLSVKDMCCRIEDLGMGVHRIYVDAPALESSDFSRIPMKKDSREFEIEWTKDPEARIRASRLVKLTDEHKWRISKPEGLSILKKSLDICPDFLKGHRLLGKALLDDGKVNESIRHFEAIWGKDPDDANSALLYSIALCLSGEAEKADMVLDHILTSKSEYWERASAFYQKGLIQKSKNDYDRAKENFYLAIDADPTHVSSIKELGMIAFETGRYDKALKFFKSILSIAENDETMNDIGAIYWTTGNKQEAYKWFVKALENNPANKSSVLNLATVGAEIGFEEEARVYVRESLNYHPKDRELTGLLHIAHM